MKYLSLLRVCLCGNCSVSLLRYHIFSMGGRKIRIALMDAAREFVFSLPEKAQKKITYNLLKVEGGEMDKELFKK